MRLTAAPRTGPLDARRSSVPAAGVVSDYDAAANLSVTAGQFTTFHHASM
jgi:hypothetical protein